MLRPRRFRLAPLVLAAAVIGPPAARGAPPSAADLAADKRLLDVFVQRVDEYVKLHGLLSREAGGPLPKDATPEQIEAFIFRLRPKIQAARSHARPGDLLVRELQPVFRRILRAELTGPAAAHAREAVLKEGNPRAETPAAAVEVKVNGVYSIAAPVSTVPPNVLRRLPPLPEQVLEYRFVGRDLILRDVGADLVVDYMKEAVP
jgi:hypothetical protein